MSVSSLWILASIMVCALVTFALRLLPFVAIRKFRQTPLITRLGMYMPLGVMTILVIYTLRDASLDSLFILPTFVGIAVTIVLHLWKNNALISMFGGVIAYGIVFTYFS